jgi:dihydroflavonol-4-reductase
MNDNLKYFCEKTHMVVLITGVTGLVGSAIAKEFLAKGFSVKALVRSQNSHEKVKAISEKIEIVEGDVLDILALNVALENVDYVIHCAAIVSFAPKDRAAMYKTNIEGTANLVNACLEKQIKKFCFISSIASFGRPPQNLLQTLDQVEIDESQKWENSDSNSHYAITKYMAECEVWRASAEGLPVVIVNPSIILGESDWTKSSTQLFKFVYDNKPFYTSGFINYVDVKDVAKAAYQLTNSEISNERYCLSAGMISYKDFFDGIAKRFNKKGPYIEVKSWLLGIVWRLEAIKSMISGNAPLVTKETAKTASQKIFYRNNKIKKAMNFEFENLENTLDRVCKYLLENKKN